MEAHQTAPDLKKMWHLITKMRQRLYATFPAKLLARKRVFDWQYCQPAIELYEPAKARGQE